MNSLIANTVLMVRPSRFGFNEESAETNTFQNRLSNFSPRQIQDVAVLEFDNFVSILERNGIEVLVYEDNPIPYTPDCIFPNNWISTCLHSKQLFIYPMKNENRSLERRSDIISGLLDMTGFQLNDELIRYEKEDKALEGTGSLVLDHQNKIAYAAISPRTDEELLDQWCLSSGFTKHAFKAYDMDEKLIYHTNVMMTMADEYVVIALDSIKNPAERSALIQQFEKTNKQVIEIGFGQMGLFTGNMLQLESSSGEKLLIMSRSAHLALSEKQLEVITQQFKNTVVSAPINMIETIGGGSARCMLGEVFV